VAQAPVAGAGRPRVPSGRGRGAAWMSTGDLAQASLATPDRGRRSGSRVLAGVGEALAPTPPLLKAAAGQGGRRQRGRAGQTERWMDLLRARSLLCSGLTKLIDPLPPYSPGQPPYRTPLTSRAAGTPELSGGHVGWVRPTPAGSSVEPDCEALRKRWRGPRQSERGDEQGLAICSVGEAFGGQLGGRFTALAGGQSPRPWHARPCFAPVARSSVSARLAIGSGADAIRGRRPLGGASLGLDAAVLRRSSGTRSPGHGPDSRAGVGAA